jgi:Concanavalin A-like lectin/glucanases superfamily
MKHLGIGFGISGLLLCAACSVEDPVATPGTAGSGGSATTAGTTSGGAATGGSSAGSGMTAGTTAGGSSAGTAAGGSSAGSGGSAAGSGGSAGSGGGSGGGGACDTKPGKAIKFVEGKKDLVAGDLMADATLADKPRTLELWAKFLGANSWTAEQSIIELGKPGAPDNGNNVFGIDMSGRKGTGGVFGPYTHGVSDNNGTSAPPFLDPAAENIGWLHLSWSYDPTKAANMRLEFTVNGNVLPTQFDQTAWDKTGGKLVGNTGYVLLGASQNFGNTGWDGVMDEVRLWSVARTAQQVKDNMNVIMKPTTPGLIAYYQFNEADAANVKDSTGNAAHKLAACTAIGGACPAANDQAPTFVDSDITGPFTCAP